MLSSLVTVRTALVAIPWVFQAWHICHETTRSVLSGKLLFVGDSGASSHMVGEDKDLFAKIPILGKVNAANRTSMPTVCKGKMNVEAIPKQGKSSKGVLTVKVAKGMLHKLFSFTTALMHEWKMYGAKKENGDILRSS